MATSDACDDVIDAHSVNLCGSIADSSLNEIVAVEAVSGERGPCVAAPVSPRTRR
jgi:hypothetical protein